MEGRECRLKRLLLLFARLAVTLIFALMMLSDRAGRRTRRTAPLQFFLQLLDAFLLLLCLHRLVLASRAAHATRAGLIRIIFLIIDVLRAGFTFALWSRRLDEFPKL